MVDHAFSRLDNLQAVLPDDALPLLGVQFKRMDFDPKYAGFFFLFPLERGIGLFDVGVQVSMSRCGGQAGQKQGPEGMFDHRLRNSRFKESGTSFAFFKPVIRKGDWFRNGLVFDELRMEAAFIVNTI